MSIAPPGQDLDRRGAEHIKKMLRSDRSVRGGVVVQVSTTISRNNHPVCANSEATLYFLDGAATPPVQEGRCLAEVMRALHERPVSLCEV